MAETFDRYWPQDVQLHFYAEDFEPDVLSERIITHDLLAVSPELVAFKQRHANNPKIRRAMTKTHWQMRGDWRKLKFKIRRKTNIGYRWDAVRFSHKTFAIFHAAEHCTADVLFWLDADIRFFADLSHDFFEELMPADCMLSYLARPKFSECGFVGYNLGHPAIRQFLTEFKELYTEDTLFKEKQWHDSYLFDVVRQRFEKQGHKTHDIGEGAGEDVGHILVNSKLGRYMDHVKGDRKDAGASYDSDLKIARKESYWSKRKSP